MQLSLTGHPGFTGTCPLRDGDVYPHTFSHACLHVLISLPYVFHVLISLNSLLLPRFLPFLLPLITPPPFPPSRLAFCVLDT